MTRAISDSPYRHGLVGVAPVTAWPVSWMRRWMTINREIWMAIMNSIIFLSLWCLYCDCSLINIMCGDAVNDGEHNFSVGCGLAYVSHQAGQSARLVYLSWYRSLHLCLQPKLELGAYSCHWILPRGITSYIFWKTDMGCCKTWNDIYIYLGSQPRCITLQNDYWKLTGSQ